MQKNDTPNLTQTTSEIANSVLTFEHPQSTSEQKLLDAAIRLSSGVIMSTNNYGEVT